MFYLFLVMSQKISDSTVSVDGHINVITVYSREGMNSYMLPPSRTYDENRIERSIVALSRSNFTKITYQSVVPNPKYIVMKTKTSDKILLPDGLVGMIRH